MEMAHTAMVLQAHWSRLRPIIQKAVPWLGGTHDEEDLLRDVLDGRATFWPGTSSFIIAEIQKFPKLKRVNFLLSGGDQIEAEQIGHKVAAWAKVMGATEMVASVRPGIDRLIRHGNRNHNGAQRARVVYTRAI